LNIEDIKNVCVVGAGNMGHQISLLCAISGYKVVCTDISKEMLDKASKFADNYLAGRVSKGKMKDEDAKKVKARLSFTPNMAIAAKDADLVIEAVLEKIGLKKKVFAELDAIAPPHAIFATNSSMIVSSAIADVTSRQSKVLNMHFFNPALVMKLVEVVKGPHVSDETAKIAMDFCVRLSKEPILIHKEIDGFVLNRLLLALNREAMWMMEIGVASAEDIDKAAVYGAGHPMGPFRLMDLTGIDVNYDILMGQFKKSGEKADYPPPSLVKHYALGQYGEKVGEGWFKYSK